MKKALFIILASILTVSFNDARAQGLQAGIKGSLNSTWLLNKHVSDAPDITQNYLPSFGESYGFSGAIFFTKKLGVEMNFLMATHSQKYTNEDEDYESETYLRKLDFPILLKLRSKTGAYVELGVQYSTFTSAEYKISSDSIQSSSIEDIRNATSKYSVDAMFGVGVDIPLFAGFDFTAALRFTGSLTDVKGVDALGKDLSNDLILLSDYNGEYEETRSLAGGFLVGITYSIGRIAGE
ncbi:MAG TPA: PorT family protein [Flavobacteriales bacterium]|nr:PorT family protein [Flavobacteriales bacterium]